MSLAQPMRILVISRCPPYPLYLGDRLILYHLARELSQMGVTLDLIAIADRAEDWTPTEQQVYTPYFDEVMLFAPVVRPSLELMRRALLASARFPKQAEQAFMGEMWRAIEEQVTRHHYDSVHLFGGIQVYEFKHALGDLPTLITPYESYALFTQRALQHQRGLAWLMAFGVHQLAKHFERWMFNPYDAVTVLTEPDRDMLLRLQPRLKVSVIPNGIDLAHYVPVAVEREPATLLFVGNYEYRPNVEAALWLTEAIFPRIQRHQPNAKLWLVGNAPPPELLACATDSVIVTGRVTDVRDYYQRATVFICPLRVGAGIKNKVLEAMASQLPVVATTLSADGIDAQHGKTLFMADSAEEIAQYTLDLLRDEGLRQRFADSARALIVERYSWRSVAEQYLERMRSITRQASPPDDEIN